MFYIYLNQHFRVSNGMLYSLFIVYLPYIKHKLMLIYNIVYTNRWNNTKL